MQMGSSLDRWYTIADKYLLRFSSIDTVVVCRVCCACVCELFVYYLFIYYFIFFISLFIYFNCNVMSVIYVKLVLINSD